MKIAYISEMGNRGQISRVGRDFDMMRTEWSWPCALEADLFPFDTEPHGVMYDLGLVILPKQHLHLWRNSKFFERARKFCKKIAIMQEGPHWCFQDYKLEDQIWYYNSLKNADILYVHNKLDIEYYKGITDHKDIRILPSLMVTDRVENLPEVERDGVMIGGNFVSWYVGFDSYIVAKSIDETIYSPQMGRRQEGEEQLGINQLPYMSWVDWIKALNNRKYGIHLMRTHAAGTFALNCAFLGIPCIGYKGLDTQEVCHPQLSIEIGEIEKAKEMLGNLKNNSYFYKECSEQAKENYKKYYHEDIFNTTFKKQFKIS